MRFLRLTKKVKTKINLILTGGKVIASSGFDIKPEDYKIQIPNLVKEKIAKNIETTFNFTLEAQ